MKRHSKQKCKPKYTVTVYGASMECLGQSPQISIKASRIYASSFGLAAKRYLVVSRQSETHKCTRHYSSGSRGQWFFGGTQVEAI